jgi:putative ABC transport system permease protein
VLGISQSSKADLLAQLDSLGTNLLTAGPGQSFFGEDATLPTTAAAAVSGMPTVQRSASVAAVDASVRRTDRIPAEETGGIAVKAADRGLLATLQGRLTSGRFLDRASERFPTVVLGAVAAERLGIGDATRGLQLYVGGHWLTVSGILAPLPLAPDLDRAALVGYPAAATLFGTERNAEKLYVRADPEHVRDARALLAPTANPESPEEVQVSRPSDALAARAAAKGAFTALLLGLGAVALLVGGVGIANVMVISVLERRSEIGLRRALGATRQHIGTQFICEALLLAALGGTAGIALGAIVTAGYATSQGWAVTVPALAIAGGASAALAIGAVAGLYPALRAARLSPTEALRGA